MERDTLNADVCFAYDWYWLTNSDEEYSYVQSITSLMYGEFNPELKYTGESYRMFLSEQEFKLPKEFME